MVATRSVLSVFCAKVKEMSFPISNSSEGNGVQAQAVMQGTSMACCHAVHACMQKVSKVWGEGRDRGREEEGGKGEREGKASSLLFSPPQVGRGRGQGKAGYINVPHEMRDKTETHA